MSPALIGILSIVFVIALMFLRVPVAFSMLIVAFFGMVILNSAEGAFSLLGSTLYSSFASYTMSVVPLFALMGMFAANSGVGKKLFDTANAFLGHISGGLCIAVQAACAVFGAICGSNSATVVTIGSVACPQMKRLGYDDTLATSAVASGACLASLIPPSVVFIVYGTATDVSIGKLFVAGIIPGIVMMLIFILLEYVMVKRKPELAPIKPKATWTERRKSLTNGGIIEVVVVFALSIGGVFLGWFTPTEGGAIGAAGMLIVCLISRQMTWKAFKRSVIETTKLTAMIFMLVSCATVYSRFFAMTRISTALGDFITNMSVPNWVIFAIILVIYLVMGMIIDAMAMILLTIPVFYPIICTTMGYDPIWFGVLIVLVLSMGSITPPIGLNCFVLQGVVPEVPLYTIFRGVWPYVFGMVLTAVLIMFFPQMALFLPNLG